MYILKSEGEGSRGGIIIGHTASGDPIYNSHGKQLHITHTGKGWNAVQHTRIETPISGVHHITERKAAGGNVYEGETEHGRFKVHQDMNSEGKVDWTDHDHIPRGMKSKIGRYISSNDMHFHGSSKSNSSFNVETVKKSKVTTRSAAYGLALDASIQETQHHIFDYHSEVASVAVMNGDLLLLGKRRDDGRWTMPGGHLDRGETAHAAALRELKEETGIDAHQLTPLGSKGVITHTGKNVLIHAFFLSADAKTTTRLDPDKEVSEWRWVNTVQGLPKEIEENLHSPKNFVLFCLGLQKSLKKRWDEFFIESEFYITDMVKSMIGAERPGHKYLRRYKGPDGQWVYVYHEGEAHGRQIPVEAIEHIRKLAELGDEHAKALHDSLQDHDEDKIELLRMLGDLGDVQAVEHLKKIGIDHADDRAKRKAHKVEQAILEERNSNPLSSHLPDNEKTVMHDLIKTAVNEAIFVHLSNYRENPLSIKLREGAITIDSIMAPVLRTDSVKDAITELHRSLKTVDRAHTGLSSANSSATAAGGYSGHAFNKAVDSLTNANYVPRAMRDEIKRTVANRDNALTLNTGRHRDAARALVAERSAAAERSAREARERAVRDEADRVRRETEARAEAERRATVERELEGSMAMHINSLMSRGGMTANEISGLHIALGNIFGRNMRKEDWPYDFSAHGVNVKIGRADVSGSSVSFSFETSDSNGRPITVGWDREWSKASGGGVSIYNRYLVVNPSQRGTVKIGDLINKAQNKMMRELSPAAGSVTVGANCDVGGYNWANQGFDFKSSQTLEDYRSKMKTFARSHGITLTDADMRLFTMPCHFSSFDPGVIVRAQVNGRAANLHLGKAFMLGKSWSGIAKTSMMNESNPAYRYFMNYNEMKERTWKILEPEFVSFVAGIRGRRATPSPAIPAPAAAPAPAATPSPSPPPATNPATPREHYYTRTWSRTNAAGRRVITMSERRMIRLLSQPDADVRQFFNEAYNMMTRAARNKIRQTMRASGRTL